MLYENYTLKLICENWPTHNALKLFISASALRPSGHPRTYYVLFHPRSGRTLGSKKQRDASRENDSFGYCVNFIVVIFTN